MKATSSTGPLEKRLREIYAELGITPPDKKTTEEKPPFEVGTPRPEGTERRTFEVMWQRNPSAVMVAVTLLAVGAPAEMVPLMLARLFSAALEGQDDQALADSVAVMVYTRLVSYIRQVNMDDHIRTVLEREIKGYLE